eukprot:gb/GFBE01081826.1/.p1 GENE.gb/GFBE01081826.1/~~gb/GFBE01081826.1/.p1  ORF type:complete len:514 (+),score=101.51 gb/GFBE01081826.1/:1-1542(+)
MEMTRVHAALLLLLCHQCLTGVLAQDDHAGHDHGGGTMVQCPWTKPWEWEAVFHFEKGGAVFWNAEKAAATGKYAEDTMKFLILNTNEASEERLAISSTFAENAWSGTWTPVTSGATLTPGQPYILQFDTSSWMSSFKIDAPAESNFAFFAEHLPSAFETNLHYLIGADGHNALSSASASILGCESAVEEMHERWGEVIGASVLTILPTLLGIGFLVLTLSPATMAAAQSWLQPVNAAASGVVFAAAVFLLLPEALHLVAVGKDESTAAGVWGACILAGWFLGVCIDHSCTLFAFFAKGQAKQDAVINVEPAENGKEAEHDCETVAKSEEPMERSTLSIAGPVILGDMFHNLADGFVIGTAFKSCDVAFAMKITAVTMAHEIPQELADFLVLIGRAKLHWCKATLLNFFSGLATLVGAVVAHSAQVSQESEGIILAIGAGVYIYVAATELGPSVAHLDMKPGVSPLLTSLTRLLGFALGATCIGLVLLDHAHCGAHNHGAADASADSHAGHNH